MYTVLEKGGVCSPKGFTASGICAGIKASGNADMFVYTKGKDVIQDFTTADQISLSGSNLNLGEAKITASKNSVKFKFGSKDVLTVKPTSGGDLRSSAISIGGAAATTVICYACPAMVVIWESFYHKRLPRRGEVIAVILAISGVFLLVTGGNPTKLLVPLGCVVWSLLSGATFAFSAIFPKHLFAKKIDPYFLTGVGIFIGGLSTFALIDDWNWLPFFAPDVLFDVSWIIIFGTVGAFLSFNAGLKFLTPEEASITATTEPAASVIMSWLIFGTAFGLAESIGIILVLLAIVAPSIIKR